MPLAIEILSPISNSLFKVLVKGSRRIRILLLLAVFIVAFALIIEVSASAFRAQSALLHTVAGVLGVIGGFVLLGIGAYQHAIEQTQREKVIQTVEERVRNHPDEPQAAWELGRIKLESYLNRNLAQVNWIFILTLIVMFAGFVIIGYGVVRVYQSPENFNPSIVVTVSGVVVEFIAATFLLIYRSTVEQAKEYVNILERINAVGMSVQILESIEGDDKGLRDKTRAEIAKGLLSLYGSMKNQNLPIGNGSN